MLKVEIFVVELASVDRDASSAVSTGEITALNHEVRNDSVESASFKLQGLSVLDYVSSAKGCEVFRGLWDSLSEEINDDISRGDASNLH